jgi:hypothetical protein
MPSVPAAIKNPFHLRENFINNTVLVAAVPNAGTAASGRGQL